MTREISEFLMRHEETMTPLSIDYSLKFWEFSIDGTDAREKALLQTVKAQQAKIENLTERVIRLETALEIALVAQGKRPPGRQIGQKE